MNKHRYFSTDYEYDLISGNVNKVIYQKDKPDRFFHRYEYDGNNRLANTFTSRNGLIWDEDAFYAYYPHGPLLRTELGENKVQGIDYAYTLQGWLKGVNSATMNSADDMGKDGQLVQGNPNALIGRDVFGFTLDYYHDTLNHKYDFLAIGRNDQGFVDFEPNRLQSDLYQPGVSLFNGNISYMTTAIASPSGLDAYPVQISSAPMVRKFRYDKLNRIAEQEVAFVGSNKSWNNATTAYATNYSYDANGNLLSLNRNQQTGIIMDSLQYKYFTSNDDYYSGQKINRLDSVVDLSVYNQYELDFKDTSSYTYDAIGNLITDSGEEIEEIVWNTYGKVTHVIREDGSLKSDLEFWYDPMGNRLCKIVKPRDEYGYPTNQSQWVFTWYMRDAQGNVMAVYNETHATDTARLYVGEYSIYGSSRLGVHNSNELISEIEYDTWQFADGFFKSDWTEIAYTELNDTTYSVNLSDVQYELSNHLGNVLTTISSKSIFLYDQNDVFEYKSPEILTVSDFYPFGSNLSDYQWIAQGMGYRYGFNSQEKDDEIYGSGNSYTAEYWQYDARLGRRWNLDPVVKHYESPYATFANNPIWFVDPFGLDTFIVTKKGRISDPISAEGDHVFVMGKRKEMRTKQIQYEEGGKLQDRHKNISVDRSIEVTQEFSEEGKNTVLKLGTEALKDGESLFDFFADNTKVEWGYNAFFELENPSNPKAILQTSHRTGKIIPSEETWKVIEDYRIYALISDIHSHPPNWRGKHYPKASPPDKKYKEQRQNKNKRTSTIFLIYSNGIFRDFDDNIID